MYLAGDLDGYFGSYDAPIEEVESDLDSSGGYQYEKHMKKPSVPFPTWQEILDSIRENCDPYVVSAAERIFSDYGKKMDEPCMEITPPPDAKDTAEDGEIERTITITIRANPVEEMFCVETSERGIMRSMEFFGPTPLWSNWETPLRESIGNTIVSLVRQMTGLDDEKE